VSRKNGRMPDPSTWLERVSAAWEEFESLAPDVFLDRIGELAAEGPEAEGLFERASALDALGREIDAVPLYERALEAGLEADRRREAVIQLASSLRNIGRNAEAIELLERELAHGEQALTDEVRAFLSLALASAGRADEGLAVALEALAPHLTRYSRSVLGYAGELRRGAVGGAL
jgi:tetratricopeptide (TPR) repeat protein